MAIWEEGALENFIVRAGRLSGWVVTVMVPVCLGLIFFYAPAEVQQGEVQKIFYIHVPVAILSYVCFSLTAVGGALYLWTSKRTYDRIAYSSAELGLLFCSLLLILGPLWAKPVWGQWWTWEARLTLTLVLWFVYLAYVLLRQFTDGQETAARFSAVLGILGIAIIPFIRIAVERFRGNHPGNPFKAGLPMEMEVTFYICLATSVFVCLHALGRRLALEKLKDEVRGLQLSVDER